MSDPALDYLLNYFLEHCGKKDSQQALWLADEQIDSETASRVALLLTDKSLSVISNRYDVSAAFGDQKQCFFNDFDFSVVGQPPSIIGMRVAKEKALVHHIINKSFDILPEGGQLLVTGAKNEGIKTYAKQLQKRFGDMVSLEKNGNFYTAMAIKSAFQSCPIDDKNYAVRQQISSPTEVNFYTKPGQFGWNKIDPGSEFLLQHLMPFCDTIQKLDTPRLLDLGCGYGFISVMAHHSKLFTGAVIDATDNNAAAIACAQKNFNHHGIEGQVVAGNCGNTLTKRYDLILCNPPFHQGFAVSGDLTDRFLKAAARLLKPSGRALFVVNQFVPLEKKAQALDTFQSINEMGRNKSFKVIGLIRKP